ncbi:MAG: cell division protein SepF [Methanomassiliicoccales archaeon]|nr:MAG: cell division protein SepF [Methanomassiliicoccales archaeon]
MPILKKPLKRGKDDVSPVETEQYIDLGAMFFPEESSLSGASVKVAEIYRYEDVGAITQPVYDGNVLLIDYSNMANDTNELKRVTSELKNVARDCNGDVAAIGNNLIVVTPNGMRIDRNKIRGGFH